MKRVLIIEDSPTDILLFKEAIRECKLDAAVTILHSWSEADGNERLFAEVSLILLDLNMPGIDGREVVRLIRSRGIYIPIIVFSTSSSPTDIRACYKAGANAYIVKPYDVDKLFDTVCATFKWWLELNMLGDIHE